MTGNYICPMHAEVRETRLGKCPACGMNLVPEGTRFAMLQHMAKSPVMIAIMAVVMVAIMIAAMKLM